MKTLSRLIAPGLVFASSSLFAAENANNPNANAAASNTAVAVDTTNAPAATTTTTATQTTTKPAKHISMSNLLQQLQKAGYLVKSAEFKKDDGMYKVDAIDRHGNEQSLDVNAATGLSADQKKVPHETSMMQAAKKVEKAGTYVSSIKMDGEDYKVTVMDDKGNETNYTINAKTGKASNS